ncbi:hypothetical protein NFK84_14630 [Enterobacter ludwigii]|uniref:hypothetical protein n=1 Tax=Enterobacter ludwigii TaxID=299767 RepID=UPI0024317B1B|nr:hypothetical protein [Enterobacter ludwigii]WGA02961.1 hypothetical protein NFK84_14630 [Enterobacter ludwigii]
MTEEQKVLYIFNQTCILLSGNQKVRSDGSPGLRSKLGIFSPPQSFDEAYSWVEAKLNEKLSVIND